MKRHSGAVFVALTMLLTPAAGFATVSPAGAGTGGTSCATGGGLVSFWPGVTNSARAQNVVFLGLLHGCTGDVTDAALVGHLPRGGGKLTCADLAAGTQGSATGTLVIKWSPRGTGNSHAAITVSGTGPGTVHVSGTMNKGPFGGMSISADASLTPWFIGHGTPCSNTNRLRLAWFANTSAFAVS